MKRTSGERSHVVADAIHRILESNSEGSAEHLTTEIMEVLEEMRVVSYRKRDTLPLLSVAGRTLVLITEHPDMTLREIATRMGVTESNVQRSVTALATTGLIKRERVGRSNQYSVNFEELIQHPDVWRPMVALHEAKPGQMTNLT
jgi:predicted transcriptional regulator